MKTENRKLQTENRKLQTENAKPQTTNEAQPPTPWWKEILNGLWFVLKWILIILFFPLSLIFVAYFRRRRKY